MALVAASGAQAIAYAGAAFIATKLLDVDSRGVMVTALTVSAFIPPIACLGSGNSFRSRIPTATAEESKILVVSYTRIGLAGSVGGGFFALAASVGLSYFSDASLRSIGILFAVFLSAFTLTSLIQLTEAWFAFGWFKAGARWSSAAALVGLAGTLVGYLVDDSAAALMIGQSVGMLLVVSVAIYQASRNGFVSLFGSNETQILDLLKHGTQSIGLPIGAALLLRSDRLILATMTNSAAVAIYALAATLAESVRLAPTAAAQLVTRDIAEKRKNHSMFKSYVGGIIAVVCVGTPVLISAHFLFVPIFGEAYSGSANLLNVLLLSEIGYSLFIMSQRALIGGGWNWEVSVIGIAGGLLAVPAYLAGARLGGAMGCAWGAVAIYTFIGCAGAYVVKVRIKRDNVSVLANGSHTVRKHRQ